MKDYIEQASQTLSGEFHGKLVPLRILQINLKKMIEAGSLLDKVKKSLFYGRPNAFAWVPPHAEAMADATCGDGIENNETSHNLLHGLLGVLTEGVELAECIANTKGGSVDFVNLKKEVGDLLWYIALLCKAGNFTIEEAMEVNIAKLRIRYPYNFSSYDAQHRDLTAERGVLEGG